ncbi:MAG: hypothetical protein CYPHOPRED_006103 [Cyphobasidiales sp. Tagirdzhanova-0007]|nr:MAG: hypothetical protein CYPHOPRED_006103 [Cyphobasidiales sp. Tagirdzhanova-0007]
MHAKHVGDEGIAYIDVRNDKSETSWLLLQYCEGKKDKLELAKKGTGNAIAEIKPLLKDDQAMYGYARIDYANDKESQRQKFILIIYIGTQVKVMRRAKISVQKGDVVRVLKAFSIEVPIDSADHLNEVDIVKKLRAAGGANYGPGT